MNPIFVQQAKQIWPGANDREIDILMWACTEYPEGPPDEVLAALKDAYSKSGGDLMQALHLADERETKRLTTVRQVIS